MKHLGYIRITNNGIRFEYHELPKPDWNITLRMVKKNGGEEHDAKMGYNIEMKEYNASRREVEVSNDYYNIKESNPDNVPKGDFILIKRIKHFIPIKHNQPCEAEVNGKATITKIT